MPSSLLAGRGTAVFLRGVCFHRRETLRGLEVLVDGERHRSSAWGMPRPDLGHSGGPELGAHHSGFWATVPISARDHPGAIEIGLVAHLADSAEIMVAVGRIEIVERVIPAHHQPPPEPSGRGLIAICMATFDPDMGLFRAQIDSLRAQTDTDWVCLVSDDCSPPERFDEISGVLAGDSRFVVSRSERRLGFYRNFERALELVPADAALVALCDQDDRWYPEKLEVLRGALGSAGMAYSDQRLVDADGGVRRETLWEGRRNNHTDLASLLIANSVTGAATLFRREVAELALPFPDTPGWQFHDHWLGLVALASGEVAYVDRPLYDYVQHAGAIFGDVSQSTEPAPGGGRSRLQWLSPRAWRRLFAGWRAAYFYGYLSREVQAQALLARCSATLIPAKRRALTRFVASARSPAAFAWLATRALRPLVGLNETLGTEALLARGILWRWLIAVRARGAGAPVVGSPDASFPGPEGYEETRLRRWRARA